MEGDCLIVVGNPAQTGQRCEFSAWCFRNARFRTNVSYVPMSPTQHSTTQWENIMRTNSILQKLEIYVVAAAAVLLVVLSGPAAPRDYGLTDVSTTASPGSSSSSSATSQELQPALREPALRTLDGVAHHG